MLIICLGMKRSGSTWQYNAVRNLVELQDLGASEGFIADDELEHNPERLKAWARDDRIHVIKTHARYDHDAELLAAGQIVILYTYRDLRTAAVSLKRQFGAHGQRLQDILDGEVETYYWVERLPRVLMQRYEHFTSDPDAAVREICAFLDWNVSDELVAQVVQACSPEAMKKVADAEKRSLRKTVFHWIWHLNRRFPIKQTLFRLGFRESWWVKLRRKATPYDSKTLLRPGHVASATATVQETLSAQEMHDMEQQYAQWLEHAGYIQSGETDAS